MKDRKTRCETKKITSNQYLEGYKQKEGALSCSKCAFPISKKKKYKSYSDLLFDKKICNLIERGNTCLPYRDTQERLLTIRARQEYSSKIGPSGKALCKPPYYYPKN